MKIKKFILSMVSAIVMVILFMSQTVLAVETGSWKFTEINAESFPSTISESNPEFGLNYDGSSIGTAITQIGTATGSRILNAYCAMANVGFENRSSWTNDASKYEDTYTSKYNMNIEQSAVQGVGMYTDSTKYKQILTLADLFYLGNTDEELEAYLKPLVDNQTLYYDDYTYAQLKTNNALITPNQIRAVQQAALWYFTNDMDYTSVDEYNDRAAFLYYRTTNTSTYTSLAGTETINNIQNNQAKQLYKYLINTAKTNAANTNYTYLNTVNLYLDNATDDEQPIIEIEKGTKEFDLALRKHISKVTSNGTSTSYNAAGERVANVDTSNLNDPDTTAIYKHRKDPVVVKTGDIVEYTLTVYNEGDIAGRATTIVDQLPTGVKLQTTGTVTSTKGNVYSISYDETNNRVTFTTTGTNNLVAYTNQAEPDKDSIVIECKVEAEPDEEQDKIYTNIAWIADYKNDANYKDRDSNKTTTTPTIPTNLVTTDNGYTNNDTHNLKNKDHYFEGQEDDDDFEKIMVKAIKGSYNIVLVKEDKNGEQLNDTATFEVDGVTKTVTGRLTIVENKQITTSNVGTVDTYIIKETVPPDEYCAFDGTIKIEVYKKLDRDKYVVDSIKYYVDNVEVTTNREDLDVYLNTDGNIYVEVKDYQFDLALRKFITKIATKSSDYEEYTEYNEAKNRVPDITGQNVVTNVQTGETEDTTAQKQHTKTPLHVAKGDKVTYTIRIYNEGQVDGYAAEVTDYLPDGLTLISKSESTINTTYNWVESTDENGKAVITSTYLKDNNKIIKASNDDFSKLDEEDYYEDLLVECIVNDKATTKNLKNIAAITKYEDKNGKEVEDRDSDKGSIDRDNYKDQNSEDGIGEQDDDDFEDLKLVELDLALRKFITRVADNSDMTDATEYNRAPTVSSSDIEKLYKDEITTANYNHNKQPVKVNVGDYVEYTLRVYNEGSMDGYARKITDHLPEYLEYVNCDLNKAYNWDVSKDGRTVTTDYLNTTKLKAVSEVTMIGGLGQDTKTYVLDSTEKLITDTENNELKIICKVKDTVPYGTNQTNIAEITKYGDKDNKELDEDRDSQTTGDGLVKLPTDKELPDYKKSEIDSKVAYIPGQQDDDDFEKVYTPRFDLSLRKFITSVNEKAPAVSREPEVDVSELKNGTSTTAKYEHTKEPVDVVNGDIVEYTLRIYNEGNVAGYASVITDDIPEGTEFLPENATNKEYRWVMYAELPEGVEVKDESKVVELNINADSKVKKYVETTDASKAVIIRTDYLSMEQGQERMKADTSIKTNPNLIKAFDGETLDYKDVKIAFKVTEPNGSERILINYAQISDDQDEDGKKVKDIDSETDKWNEGEDDQDIEKLRLPIFDLALRKWVTEAIVTENGKTTVTKTGHEPWDDEDKDIVKVELNRRKLSDVTVKFRYSIRVYNQGEIEGYAKEVTDYIPEGLRFVAEDNPDWTDEGNNVISTRKLENTLLKPGEYADVEVLLTWINNKDNMGLKRNTAEISEDYNEKGVPDKDSTPDNQKPGEDDIDDAPVLLSISTGKEVTYIALGTSILVVLAAGIFLIKKYVL